MKVKRVVGSVAILLLVLAGMAYHFVFGYVESTQIDDQITVLTRKNVMNQIGGNVVVYAGSPSGFVVDTQLSLLATSTRSYIDALISSPNVSVIITHWHPDHSGGISAFSSDANVIAHESVLQRLSAPQEGFGLTKPGSHHEFAARTADGLPNQTIARKLDLPSESSKVNVVHYPRAHTDGDLVVFFHDSRVAVIGDLIWPSSFPYVDVHNGGTVAGLESALQELLAVSKPDYRFVPGHGAVLTFDDVREYLDMVSQSRRWVESRLEEGQTVDQIAAADLPDAWKDWGSSLVPATVWVQMIRASRGMATAANR